MRGLKPSGGEPVTAEKKERSAGNDDDAMPHWLLNVEKWFIDEHTRTLQRLNAVEEEVGRLRSALCEASGGVERRLL